MQTIKLLPHQGYYLQAPFLFPEIRFFMLCCGYGAGKTQANVFLVMYLVKMLHGKKDAAGNYARIIVAGYTLAHLNKTLLIYLRQLLDSTRSKYTENKKDNYMVIGTVTLLFTPLENPEAIFGFDAHACVVEELDELPEDKAIEAVRALSERCRQRIAGQRDPFLAFASTSQGQKGLYRIYCHFKKTGVGFVLMRGRTEDNIHLPKSMINDMKKMYTEDEYRVFMLGEFLSIAKGRVLGDFDWERNYLDYDLDRELLPGETVYIGMDFNESYNRASAYVMRDAVIYAVKYYDFTNPQDAPAVFRHDFPLQRILWIPDVTIKDSFPQYARELRRYNIHIIYRKKSPLVEDSCFLVNKLFYTRRLLICRIARDLAEACALFMRDKDNKIPKGKGPNSAAHAVDSIRYVCTFIAANKREFRDMRRLVMDKRVSLRSDKDGQRVRDMGDGYTEISPEALRGRKRA